MRDLKMVRVLFLILVVMSSIAAAQTDEKTELRVVMPGAKPPTQ